MSGLELSDFNKICRLCLKEYGTLINIFFSDAAEVISKITSITLNEGDYLPENICIPCMDKATAFYKFQQLCEKSNTTLQAVLTLSLEVDNGPNNTEDFKEEIESAKQEIKDNQKENNFTTFKEQLRTGLDQHFDNNTQIDLRSNSKNQINISFPLKTRDNRKIEIKRSFKDLIPLEAYNNNKSTEGIAPALALAESQCKDTNHTIQNIVNEYQETESEHDHDIHNANFQSVDIKEEAELEEIQSEEKGWCEYCCISIEFDQVQKHLEEYHPAGSSHYCYVCPKGVSSTYGTVKRLQAHLRYHKQLPKFQCDICGKWFRYKHQKLVHMRLHTGERPAICQICNKTFRDPRYLVIHLKSHTGEKPFKCTICQKGFGHKFSLKVHMKTHSTEREHMCNICGKTFIYGHNLKIHLRQHTGEKPYACHLCFTSFISCSVLRAHMLTHSDQKRFECKVCGKRCKRTGDLNIHMRSHTGEKPYACTLCSNKYKMSSHLTEHLKTHTGEKNYICEICSKSFYNNKSLQVHKKTHTGQKSYSCQECDKSFVHHTSLCAHQRKQHRH